MTMMRSEKDKMLAGDLYDPSAAELRSDQAATNAWLARLNTATTMSMADRCDILAERFAAIGANVEIRSPFHCDYGFNISVGNGAFLNFNCVILDVVAVTIGDKTQIGRRAFSSEVDAVSREENALFLRKPDASFRSKWIGKRYGVQILTADHPREAAARRAGLEFGRPVHIGSNVWIGGGAIILPGVIIGDNAFVGAGSVVTRNVPAGATGYGNPARIK
jgi:maltose O-acetyltransferase